MKIEFVDVVVGSGVKAVSGKQLTINFVGWLADGTKFDSSFDHGQPFSFKLGGKQVIAGWDEGVKGMCVGGKRRLTVPSEMGFGKRGFPPIIPSDAVLTFEIDLLEVK